MGHELPFASWAWPFNLAMVLQVDGSPGSLRECSVFTQMLSGLAENDGFAFAGMAVTQVEVA